MKQTGNAIHIDVHVKFSGKGIDKELLKDGIERFWTTKLDEYTVITRVIEPRASRRGLLNIYIKDEPGISKVSYTRSGWNGVNVRSVTLYPAYPGYPAYTDVELMRLSAHEGGHVFGLIGNAKSGGEDPRDTDTIMGTGMWKKDDEGRYINNVTVVNIEKMLAAQITGIRQ